MRSMLDVGCGPGGMVELAVELGIDAHGIDGDSTLRFADPSRFTVWDFTHGVPPLRPYDLAYSCEFLEHVEARFVENFMPCFAECAFAVVTFAPPGKPGHHHVNCQPAEYWIELFQRHGLDYDRDLTDVLRLRSRMAREFMRETGLFFRRRK